MKKVMIYILFLSGFFLGSCGTMSFTDYGSDYYDNYYWRNPYYYHYHYWDYYPGYYYPRYYYPRYYYVPIQPKQKIVPQPSRRETAPPIRSNPPISTPQRRNDGRR